MRSKTIAVAIALLLSLSGSPAAAADGGSGVTLVSQGLYETILQSAPGREASDIASGTAPTIAPSTWDIAGSLTGKFGSVSTFAGLRADEEC